jgi:hypothetical protein
MPQTLSTQASKSDLACRMILKLFQISSRTIPVDWEPGHGQDLIVNRVKIADVEYAYHVPAWQRCCWNAGWQLDVA